MCNVLRIRNIEKTFVLDKPLLKGLLHPFARAKRTSALRSVSFDVTDGQILAVMGPNEAGKTTLLRILADLLEPDSGSIKVLGEDIRLGKGRMRKQIGYVGSDERSFFWKLTGRENLEFFGKLYGLNFNKSRNRTSELLEQFGFEKKADQPFKDYSAGMRKKVSVMRALLHKPVILLLDEVTNSLDFQSTEYLMGMVREYVRDYHNCAAIWCTNRIEEIHQVCDRVIVLDQGCVISEQSIKDFQSDSDVPNKYLLRAKSMKGKLESFCEKLSTKIKDNPVTMGDMHEFIFTDIGQDEFGEIVNMAVKNYGAYIVFAGCVTDTSKGQVN